MQKKGNRDDRLSTLPDDILVNILDRLNVPEAARTSILSKRWIRLSSELSHLIINAKDFVPEGLSNANVSVDDLVQMNAAAAQVTKSMLTRRVPGKHTISLLSTTFYLRDAVPISIGHAVGNAMATHKIEKAEFTVLTERDDVHCNDGHLISYGRQFMLFFDACPDAFGGLTHLRLENLRFGELDISNVLITCKRLQHLRLFNCDSGSSTVLHVEHPQISELSIVDCSFERVELNSLPKLTWMMFWCWKSQDPLLLGHVPLLETVSITNHGLSWPKLVELSKFFGGASPRYLWLGFECEKVPLEKPFC
jgi:hypothetical protein